MTHWLIKLIMGFYVFWGFFAALICDDLIHFVIGAIFGILIAFILAFIISKLRFSYNLLQVFIVIIVFCLFLEIFLVHNLDVGFASGIISGLLTIALISMFKEDSEE